MLRSWNVDGHLVFPFFLLCLPSTFSSGQQSAFLMIFIYVSPGDHISSLQQERGASEWSLKKVSEWTWSSFLNNSSRFHYSDSHSRVRAVPAERHSWRIKKKNPRAVESQSVCCVKCSDPFDETNCPPEDECEYSYSTSFLRRDRLLCSWDADCCRSERMRRAHRSIRVFVAGVLFFYGTHDERLRKS